MVKWKLNLLQQVNQPLQTLGGIRIGQSCHPMSGTWSELCLRSWGDVSYLSWALGFCLGTSGHLCRTHVLTTDGVRFVVVWLSPVFVELIHWEFGVLRGMVNECCIVHVGVAIIHDTSVRLHCPHGASRIVHFVCDFIRPWPLARSADQYSLGMRRLLQ